MWKYPIIIIISPFLSSDPYPPSIIIHPSMRVCTTLSYSSSHFPSTSVQSIPHKKQRGYQKKHSPPLQARSYVLYQFGTPASISYIQKVKKSLIHQYQYYLPNIFLFILPLFNQSRLITLKLLLGFNITPRKLGSCPAMRSSVLLFAVLSPRPVPIGRGVYPFPTPLPGA
jgi:hypothetical protein